MLADIGNVFSIQRQRLDPLILALAFDIKGLPVKHKITMSTKCQCLLYQLLEQILNLSHYFLCISILPIFHKLPWADIIIFCTKCMLFFKKSSFGKLMTNKSQTWLGSWNNPCPEVLHIDNLCPKVNYLITEMVQILLALPWDSFLKHYNFFKEIL